VVKTFTNIEELVGAVIKLERVLGVWINTIWASKGRTRRRNFRDHDGKVGHCFEQHVHQFL